MDSVIPGAPVEECVANGHQSVECDLDADMQKLLNAAQQIVQLGADWGLDRTFHMGTKARMAHHIANSNYKCPPLGMVVEEDYKTMKKMYNKTLNKDMKGDCSALGIVKAIAGKYPHDSQLDISTDLKEEYDKLICGEKCTLFPFFVYFINIPIINVVTDSSSLYC